MTDPVPGVMMILDSVFPSVGGGGAEAQVATLARWLLRRGVPATIVVPMVSAGPQVRHERIDGIEVIRIPYPKWRWIGSLIMLIRLGWLLVRRRRTFGALHAHIGNNMAVVATVVGRLLDKPVLIKMTGMTEMQGGVLDHDVHAGVRWKRRLMRHATAVQATSRQIADRLVDHGFAPDRIHRIPNAVDVERFDPARIGSPAGSAPDAADRDLVAVYVGRLEPEKGVDLLLDAWHDAFAGAPGPRLVIVGTGSLQRGLQARADALGLAGQVRFAGRSDQVESHLAAADVGVLASHAEGLSNTMLETMAAGLPMIGSRVSGADDFIEPGVTGWLFPPGDRAALADALRTARDAGAEARRRMGARARELIVARASMAVIGERLLLVYGLAAPTVPMRAAGAAGH